MPHDPYTFLALGDSYTIGELVSAAERWPAQLVQVLRRAGIPMADPLIIARSGWTTGELAQGLALTGLSPRSRPFDLVSLLIGVNNQYRGLDLQEYRQEFRALLAQAVAFAGGRPGHVIVLAIPDWSATPFAAGRDPRQIAREIERFNQANREEAIQVGAHYVDISPLSRQAAGDPTLVASDGLHPSAKMYSSWLPLLLPVVEQILAPEI
jgi:lysophospholipase L1-like esterase